MVSNANAFECIPSCCALYVSLSFVFEANNDHAIKDIIIGFRPLTLGSSTRNFNVTRLCHAMIVIHYLYFSSSWWILVVLLLRCLLFHPCPIPHSDESSFSFIISPYLFKTPTIHQTSSIQSRNELTHNPPPPQIPSIKRQSWIFGLAAFAITSTRFCNAPAILATTQDAIPARESIFHKILVLSLCKSAFLVRYTVITFNDSPGRTSR